MIVGGQTCSSVSKVNLAFTIGILKGMVVYWRFNLISIRIHSPNTLLYLRYLDRWSDFNTWRYKERPADGDSVIVPYGQAVLLDLQTPKLFLFLVQGLVVWEDHSTKLRSIDAHYIWIHGGAMEIGTKEFSSLYHNSHLLYIYVNIIVEIVICACPTSIGARHIHFYNVHDFIVRLPGTGDGDTYLSGTENPKYVYEGCGQMHFSKTEIPKSFRAEV